MEDCYAAHQRTTLKFIGFVFAGCASLIFYNNGLFVRLLQRQNIAGGYLG
jgi:hypothetical protein